MNNILAALKRAPAAAKKTPAALKLFAGAAKEAVADLAKLAKPAVATTVAGVVAPIAAALLGMNITAAELGGWLAVVGLVAATLQKLTANPAAVPQPPASQAKSK